jgi:hypothetical protein
MKQNNVNFLLGDSPESEIYVRMFQNTLSVQPLEQEEL